MNSALTNFHFLRPGWLLLAPLAIGVWIWWQRRSDPLRGWREQIAPQLLAALIVGKQSNRRGARQWLLSAWLLGIAAVAGPTFRLAPSPFADDVAPLMILLKAGASMKIDDPAPSRLRRAQLKITDLVDQRAGQPLGLIAYAGSAHLVLPPTRDAQVVSQMAAEISPEIMPEPGDRLDLALAAATRALADNKVSGSLLVIADSIDTDLDALAKSAKAASLPVQILAVNTPDSSEDAALHAAASRIGAAVVPLTADDADVTKIVQQAAQAPVMRAGDKTDRWQDAGYYLVPLVALLTLLTFRQEASTNEANL